MSSGAKPWPTGAGDLRPELLDDFLLWAAAEGASDISFQSGRAAYLEVDGVLFAATGTALDTPALARIAEAIYGPTAEGQLRSGRDIDCSHEARLAGTRDRVRFRVNCAPVLAWGAFALNITLRVLPGYPPSFDELGVEPGIRRAWEEPRGLTLVTGVPGSGKSTLLAAGIRCMVEGNLGRIQTYEAPVEFVFDALPQTGALVSSAEIGRHCQSFADGLRSSLRRKPAAVVIGEARDRETVETAIRAADTGIAVFTTTHTVGVAETLRRLLAELPRENRDERGAALADTLRLVVTQALAPSARGGRVALREWLEFGSELRAALIEAASDRWTGIVREALQQAGTTLAAAAVESHARGAIDQRQRDRFTRVG